MSLSQAIDDCVRQYIEQLYDEQEHELFNKLRYEGKLLLIKKQPPKMNKEDIYFCSQNTKIGLPDSQSIVVVDKIIPDGDLYLVVDDELKKLAYTVYGRKKGNE